MNVNVVIEGGDLRGWHEEANPSNVMAGAGISK
jgi:hypothetical protein